MACAPLSSPGPDLQPGPAESGQLDETSPGGLSGQPCTPAGLRPEGLACRSCPVCVHMGPQDLALAVPLTNLHDTFGFKWTIKLSLPWQEVFLL